MLKCNLISTVVGSRPLWSWHLVSITDICTLLSSTHGAAVCSGGPCVRARSANQLAMGHRTLQQPYLEHCIHKWNTTVLNCWAYLPSACCVPVLGSIARQPVSYTHYRVQRWLTTTISSHCKPTAKLRRMGEIKFTLMKLWIKLHLSLPANSPLYSFIHCLPDCQMQHVTEGTALIASSKQCNSGPFYRHGYLHRIHLLIFHKQVLKLNTNLNNIASELLKA